MTMGYRLGGIDALGATATAHTAGGNMSSTGTAVGPSRV